MNKKVLVFSESLENIFEMINGAKQLGDECQAVYIGSEADAKAIAAHGASKVYFFEKEAGLIYESYADDIAAVVAEVKPALVMVGMSNRGRTIAAIIAQSIQAPCVSECKKLVLGEDGKYVTERRVYGGKATTTEVCEAETLVVTIPMRSYERAEETADLCEIVKLERKADYGVSLVEEIGKGGDSVDITAASTVVLFGRGLEKKEDMAMMEELADLLGGVTACTRPCSVDYGWLPHSRYVGLSGKTVKPALYLDIGSSGQIQQIGGATDSKIIVAINNKADEPVFAYSDYGIVADLYEAVPALIAELKKLR